MEKQAVSELLPPVVKYLPLKDRVPDFQQRDLLKKIMTRGRRVNPIQGGRALMIAGAQHHYLMENGAPITTLRNMSQGMVQGSIAENIGFAHGAHTLQQLVSYGLNPKWWDRWVTKEKCAVFGLPEGDLGSASYGSVWARFPTRDGGEFNQIKALIEQIRRAPHLRTHRITNWYPPEVIGPIGTRKVVVAPCHGDVHVMVDPDLRELTLHHVQRSGDFPVGCVFNTIQYTAMGMMLSHVLGYTFVELIHTFSDVHIYEEQIPFVEQLLARDPYPFPTLTLDESVQDYFDFRPKHFTVSEYQAHPGMNIPTPT